MEQDLITEEDYDEGISFKKVGYFFKKAWLRMVIYAVVLVLAAAAVVLPIKMFYKTSPIAMTSLEFVYDGIEQGLNPNGGAFDPDEIISTRVLSNAVGEAGLGDKIKNIADLRARTRVDAVLTEEYVRLLEAAANNDQDAIATLRTYKMNPTQYDIVITDYEKLNLTDSEAKNLLNKIVVKYYEDFGDKYAVYSMFATDGYNLSQNTQIEFTDVYDTYLISLDSIKTYLTEMANDNPTFVSTKNNATFMQLLDEQSLMVNRFSLFNAQLMADNIWRNRSVAKSTLNAQLDDINNRLTPLQTYITELKDQIALIKPNTTETNNGGSHTSTVQYPPEYFVYQARLDSSNNQVREYNTQIANIQMRLNKLDEVSSDDEELIARATASLVSLEEQTVAFVNKVNATIGDFYDYKYIADSVRQVRAAGVGRADNGINVIIVLACAAIVGLLAAGIVTGVKIARANAAKAKAEENTDKAVTATTDNK